eukprot:364893-Chlamydomonas_euryale.AAC.6
MLSPHTSPSPPNPSFPFQEHNSAPTSMLRPHTSPPLTHPPPTPGEYHNADKHAAPSHLPSIPHTTMPGGPPHCQRPCFAQKPALPSPLPTHTNHRQEAYYSANALTPPLACQPPPHHTKKRREMNQSAYTLTPPTHTTLLGSVPEC